MQKGQDRLKLLIRGVSCLSFCLWLILACSISSSADDSVCARVKIEILQELTLERQAFDAHMRINNGLTNIALENVNIEVSFADKDGNTVRATSNPDDTTALFFIRVSSMEAIGDIGGAGTVQPSTSADIHWLIIPAQGASNGLAQGTLYFVGATLSYTAAGEPHTTTVTPDYIYVKPMPAIVLDYFLPSDVYGDDAFTPEIEPVIPFSLGVRVQNNGPGAANSLKIDSAQPKIVENEQGLLINFAITGTEVNGQHATNSLLANFGDIPAGSCGMARWIMICSLSGKFVDFTAEFSHSDELGGQLTSLIDAVNTHFLVRDVLVDLPGRDATRDFLAKDGTGFRVYESQNVDSAVIDQSAASSLQLSGQSGTQVSYTMSNPITAGFMYVQLPDPQNGQKVLKQVVRSDGKTIKSDNAWLSKTRNKSDPWQYFVNVFDVNTTQSYILTFEDASQEPQPPVLQYIPDRMTAEGRQISFLVEASDPNGTIPMISAAPLPAGATFTDKGDGTAIFDWTPLASQSGKYPIKFTASDGVLTAAQKATITVGSFVDSDGDGMPDAWEMTYFGTLARDGSGDADGDGIPDKDEYLRGTNPVASNAPTLPVIDSPKDGTEAQILQPDLVVRNSTDPDNDPIGYVFELYADRLLTQLITTGTVAGGVETTHFALPEALAENTHYTWRVRATDGVGFSLWAYSTFFVNTENQPPDGFQISSPADRTEVAVFSPVLQVANSVDPDEDAITYEFRVYETDMATLAASVSGVRSGLSGITSWQVTPPLGEDKWYFWQAIAADEHGVATAGPMASFFVNTANDAPATPTGFAPIAGSEITAFETALSVQNAVDKDGDNLTYFFELDVTGTFASEWKRTSGAVPEGTERTTWHVDGLQDNTLYFARVKASDGVAESDWATTSFFVNSANEPPAAPILKNPGDGAWVTALAPVLEVSPVVDPDRDEVTYLFEIYSNAAMQDMVATHESQTPEWALGFALADNSLYHWRVRARDEHLADGEWMGTASFFTNNNGFNDPPEIAVLEPAYDLYTNAQKVLITWNDYDPDSSAGISLYSSSDRAGANRKLIKSDIPEDPDGLEDQYFWDVSSLPDGTYYASAVISDESQSRTEYAPGAVVIDRTAPLVQALPKGGTYVDPQSVALTANEDAKIYYTLDGTTPTQSSPQYSEPVKVDFSRKLKFMGVDRVGNQSAIITQNYTISHPVPYADLNISALSGPSTAVPGESIVLVEKTKNHGKTEAKESVTKFYWSADTNHDSSDLVLGARPVPVLPVGKTSGPVSTTVTIPANVAAGTYYIIAKADADGVIPEISEIDNTRYMTIEIGPDLIVSSLSGPSTAAPGQTISISVAAGNRGVYPAPPSTMRLYWSKTKLNKSTDYCMANLQIPALSAGASSTPETVQVRVPSDIALRTYYIVAVADSDSVVSELNEANNSTAVKIVVGPDLTISSLTASSIATRGQAVNLTETTANKGKGPAGESVTRFFLSKNSSYDTSDIPLAERNVQWLEGGTFSGPFTTTVTIPADLAPGSYYFIAVADADGSVLETSEGNNRKSLRVVILQ